jgi:hypothetical protein
VKEIFEIMALMKPVQLNESSVRDAIETPDNFGTELQ